MGKIIGRQGNTAKAIRTLLRVVGMKNKGTASEHFFGSGAAGKSQTVLALGLRHAF